MSVSPDRYAVAGHPIAHSRSPFIHALFARQTGENLTYDALDIRPEEFTARVDAFRESGGRGLNVTVPLKELAFRYASGKTERAARAGAVNTLRFDTDGALGDNTDGAGLVADLRANLGLALEGRRLLLLGAGGAARGVLGPLLDLRPLSVLVANRTPQRAEDLVRAFRSATAGSPRVTACALDAIPPEPFDLLLNATASSIGGDEVPIVAAHLAPGACCYDMMYGAEPTAFLRRARTLGAARCVDGRGMLVEQAAEAFCVWRGVRPATGPVIEALGRELNGR